LFGGEVQYNSTPDSSASTTSRNRPIIYIDMEQKHHMRDTGHLVVEAVVEKETKFCGLTTVNKPQPSLQSWKDYTNNDESFDHILFDQISYEEQLLQSNKVFQNPEAQIKVNYMKVKHEPVASEKAGQGQQRLDPNQKNSATSKSKLVVTAGLIERCEDLKNHLSDRDNVALDILYSSFPSFPYPE